MKLGSVIIAETFLFLIITSTLSPIVILFESKYPIPIEACKEGEYPPLVRVDIILLFLLTSKPSLMTPRSVNFTPNLFLFAPLFF